MYEQMNEQNLAWIWFTKKKLKQQQQTKKKTTTIIEALDIPY